jgi:2-methylcitrate dehydratase PrpD
MIPTPPLARRLAERVVAIRDGAVPPAVVARAHALLGDYLGVTLGGAPQESSVVLRAGLATLGVRGDATVLGTRARLPPPYAALANGAAAHALEMDDTHQGGSIHLGATMFSAALATAELHGGSGAAVLRAAVAGFEVAARLAMAVDPAAHYRRGFHPTGTCGAFGAAATAGALLGLDASALTAALGVAGSQASGSMEFLTDGAWTKRLHPGWSAAAGLHAAALAAAGFRAPATIVDGRFGFLHAYSDDARPELAAPEDDAYEICRTSVKPHACCRYMQGPIDAVLALRREYGLTPESVERIEVGMLSAGFAIVCDPPERKRRPESVVDAQFSLPFGVATALVRGAAGPEEFAAVTDGDPRVARVMACVTAVRDADLDRVFPRAWPAWVRIMRREGAPLALRIDHPKGDPDNFPTRDERDEKLRRLAARALSADDIGRLSAALALFPDAPDARTLLAATTPTVS